MCAHVRTSFRDLEKGPGSTRSTSRASHRRHTAVCSPAVLSPPWSLVYVKAAVASRAMGRSALRRRCHERSTHPAMGPGTSRAEPSPADIQAQLDRILASPAFRVSPRRRALLQYLVAEKLAGRADGLTGYAVEHAVFGPGQTFDPQRDPSVRFEARRLRRDLDSYYVDKGARDPCASRSRRAVTPRISSGTGHRRARRPPTKPTAKAEQWQSPTEPLAPILLRPPAWAFALR